MLGSPQQGMLRIIDDFARGTIEQKTLLIEYAATDDPLLPTGDRLCQHGKQPAVNFTALRTRKTTSSSAPTSAM